MSTAAIWWLSFGSPTTGKNLGIVIIAAASFEDALDKSWRLNLNPGGECQGCKVPSKYAPFAGKRYTKAQAQKIEQQLLS